MLKTISVLFTVLIAQAFCSFLDILGQVEHEPRVAIYCGHVAFHVDLKTGKWVSDKKGFVKCDTNKEDVKRYCQQTYPKLNISNIVEANEKVKIENWCKEGSVECNIEKKVVPYRCLVDDYEADALMVPKGCKFNHLHDEASCMTHDEWKARAKAFCKKDDMALNEYGILLSCGTDMFTGVEFVCCPREKKGEQRPVIERKPMIDRVAFQKAIKEVEKFLPEEVLGCDRTLYEKKRQKLNENHRSKIAAVVDEWDEAEARYKKMNAVSPGTAQEKMKKTLQVFRETLAALEQETKEASDRLKVEHARCIQVNINKHKRDSMLAYLLAIQEKPHSIKHILRAARKFFQDCEHDRLHSLRHFQHLRKRQPKMIEKHRNDLLNRLQQLNDLVNKSIGLLSFLPDVAEKFGMQKIFNLEPTQVPEAVVTEKPTAAPVKEEPEAERTLVDTDEGFPIELERPEEEFPVTDETETKAPTTIEPTTEALITEAEELFTTKEPVVNDKHKTIGEGILKFIKKIKSSMEHHENGPTDLLKDIKKTESTHKDPVLIDHGGLDLEKESEKDPENSSKGKLAKGTLNPTDLPPKTRFDSEGLPEVENGGQQKTEQTQQKVGRSRQDLETNKKKPHSHSFFKHPRSPAAFAAVIGLSCGALVIMLGIIVALVMRRNRSNQTRLLVQDAGPEDQEHLVKMQKSGYENPTYKFFYY